MKPEDIEKLSFEIIDKEAGDHLFMPDTWSVVRRMIHTTADFEYMETIRFHPYYMTKALEALRGGKAIITDTDMARAGLRKKELEHFGCKTHCLIKAPEVVEGARENGTTRAAAAVDAAASLMEGGIYIVGNAPTALLRLVELVQKGEASPALIIGLPVGFVKAAESKAELLALDHPYITNVGRKGGSAVAASVLNALAILAYEEDKEI